MPDFFNGKVSSLWLLLILGLVPIVALIFLPLVVKIATAVIFLFVFALVFRKNTARLVLAERKSELETRKYKTILHNLEDGAIIYDANFQILSLNQAAEKIFNLKAEEVVGKHIEPGLVKNPHFKSLAQVIFPSLAPTISRVSENTWPQIVDMTLEDPPLTLRTVLNPLVSEEGRPTEFLKIVIDETREKNILQEKSEFLTVAAHQLRTPLTAIHWAFESLSKTVTDENVKATINEGVALARRSLKIINDLLDAAKIEEGRFGYVFQSIDLYELVADIAAQAKTLADAYTVQVKLETPKEKFMIQADPERLGIALANLVDNAIRYNIKRGLVTLNIEAPKERPFIKLTIKDTGVGIPQVELDKIFTKFYRGTNVQQLEPNGSGLGLYITKNIIEKHRGEIGIESHIGRGTAFWITLPTIKF